MATAVGGMEMGTAAKRRRGLRDGKQVRILTARPNGKSGGGVDRSSLPSLAFKFTPVK